MTSRAGATALSGNGPTRLMVNGESVDGKNMAMVLWWWFKMFPSALFAKAAAIAGRNFFDVALVSRSIIGFSIPRHRRVSKLRFAIAI